MAACTPENKVQGRIYSEILLTLENVLLPEDSFKVTPSEADGLDRDSEIDLRIIACDTIQSASILLKLPQVATATAQVLFQRFYYVKSFVKHSWDDYAMACVHLASKIEEAPRRIRDVMNTFHHLKQIRNNLPITPMVLYQDYVKHKNQIIKAERRVLKELGFAVHVKHPHKIIVIYLEVLEVVNKSSGKKQSGNQNPLVQTAWNYMNDSFRTTIFLRFRPEIIACACIWLAARELEFPLPQAVPWYEIFGVSFRDIVEISAEILKLYDRSKPGLDSLELKLVQLRTAYQESRANRRTFATNEPGSTTPIILDSNSMDIDKDSPHPSLHNLSGTRTLEESTSGPVLKDIQRVKSETNFRSSKAGSHESLRTKNRERDRSRSREDRVGSREYSRKHGRDRDRDAERKKSRRDRHGHRYDDISSDEDSRRRKHRRAGRSSSRSPNRRNVSNSYLRSSGTDNIPHSYRQDHRKHRNYKNNDHENNINMDDSPPPAHFKSSTKPSKFKSHENSDNSSKNKSSNNNKQLSSGSDGSSSPNPVKHHSHYRNKSDSVSASTNGYKSSKPPSASK